jgi:hypothetical protein
MPYATPPDAPAIGIARWAFATDRVSGSGLLEVLSSCCVGLAPFPVPIPRSRGSFVPRRLHPKPRKLSAYSLPLRRFVFRRPWGLRSQVTSPTFVSSDRLPALSGHLSALSPHGRPASRPSSTSKKPRCKAPRSSFPALQHFRPRRPFFSRSLSTPRPVCLPFTPRKIPHPGFGYPLCGTPCHHDLEGLFQPSTLLGFSLQSFSPSG